MKELLRMDLQTFAEEDPEPKDEPDPNAKDENVPTDEPEGGKDTDVDPDEDSQPKLFTQEDLDRHIADRLARDRKKQEKKEEEIREEAERKKLEEQEEYKELANKLQKQLDDIKEESVVTEKKALLVSAGYTDDQIERYSKYVTGDDKEELKESVEALKADIPPTPKYADPSVGNGHKQEPKKKGLEEKGKTMYQRLKEKGKIGR